MTKEKKPRRRKYGPMSDAQLRAIQRNHRIRSLHGLAGLAKGLLNPEHQTVLNAMIDKELSALAAAPMGYEWTSPAKTSYRKIGLAELEELTRA